MLNQENVELLKRYGIVLKKENKTFSVLHFNSSNDDIRIARSLYDKLIESAKKASTKEVSLPKIYVGVELEFVGTIQNESLSLFNKNMKDLFNDKYFHSGSYSHNSGTEWILGRDGSINYIANPRVPYPFGYELSSPAMDLFSDETYKSLSKVLSLIKENLKGEVNKTCGTHVHIGMSLDKITRANIYNVLSVYSNMEKKIFDPIVPASRRRNRYCKKTLDRINNKYQKLSARFCKFRYDGSCYSMHFEFRQLEGTLDCDTIMNWAKLQAYILYDLLINSSKEEYCREMSDKNIFDILFKYSFDNDLIAFFIERLIKFKSRAVQAN